MCSLCNLKTYLLQYLTLYLVLLYVLLSATRKITLNLYTACVDTDYRIKYDQSLLTIKLVIRSDPLQIINTMVCSIGLAKTVFFCLCMHVYTLYIE